MNLETLLEDKTFDRRTLLKGSLTLSAAALISTVGIKPVFAGVPGGRYNLSVFNLHTHESYEGLYRVGNQYLPDSFEQINYTLRDHRRNEVFPMDPRVIDIAAAIHKMSGSRKPFKILSGYRSPKTNKMLGNNSGKVAKQSLHMSGQAIDLALDDVPLGRLHEIAMKLKAGGVGYYARSGFVHVDSGKFRSW